MDEDLTLSDSEKPRYLLPEGCKDLYDVIRRHEDEAALQKQKAAISAALEKLASMATKSQKVYEDLSGAIEKALEGDSDELPLSVTIPDPVTVGELADLLHLKSFKLICILIKFQIFASAGSTLTFATASQVCKYFGVAVKRAGDV